MKQAKADKIAKENLENEFRRQAREQAKIDLGYDSDCIIDEADAERIDQMVQIEKDLLFQDRTKEFNEQVEFNLFTLKERHKEKNSILQVREDAEMQVQTEEELTPVFDPGLARKKKRPPPPKRLKEMTQPSSEDSSSSSSSEESQDDGSNYSEDSHESEELRRKEKFRAKKQPPKEAEPAVNPKEEPRVQKLEKPSSVKKEAHPDNASFEAALNLQSSRNFFGRMVTSPLVDYFIQRTPIRVSIAEEKYIIGVVMEVVDPDTMSSADLEQLPQLLNDPTDQQHNSTYKMQFINEDNQSAVQETKLRLKVHLGTRGAVRGERLVKGAFLSNQPMSIEEYSEFIQSFNGKIPLTTKIAAQKNEAKMMVLNGTLKKEDQNQQWKKRLEQKIIKKQVKLNFQLEAQRFDIILKGYERSLSAIVQRKMTMGDSDKKDLGSHSRAEAVINKSIKDFKRVQQLLLDYKSEVKAEEQRMMEPKYVVDESLIQERNLFMKELAEVLDINFDRSLLLSSDTIITPRDFRAMRTGFKSSRISEDDKAAVLRGLKKPLFFDASILRDSADKNPNQSSKAEDVEMRTESADLRMELQLSGAVQTMPFH